jgi:MATE family multidrug resistance protein
VAIGAGWQAAVAFVNIGCYYIFGIPLGLILGFWLQMGVQVSLVFPFIVPNVQSSIIIIMYGPFLFKLRLISETKLITGHSYYTR